MGLHHHHEASDPEPVVSEQIAAQNIRVARISVTTAMGLALAKLAAAVATGSLAIAASLVDSLMDIVASSINFFAVRMAGQPADKRHPYGHGKAEGLAGIAQGLLIAFAGLYLLVEGTRRLVTGSGDLQHTGWGIGVMALSLVASTWLGWLLLRTARKTGSVALRADAAHYTSDVWMNGGVLVALVIVRVTGWSWVDGVVSCGVSLFVLHAAFVVLRASIHELMDHSLPPDTHDRIKHAIEEDVPEARDVHRMRTRKSGPDVFVDLHVAFDRTLSFPEAHRLSERVARSIERTVPGAQVHVHADPHPFLPEEDAVETPAGSGPSSAPGSEGGPSD